MDQYFLAEEDHGMKECPEKCDRAYGWESRRLCNLPETLLIFVDRVQLVRLHASCLKLSVKSNTTGMSMQDSSMIQIVHLAVGAQFK